MIEEEGPRRMQEWPEDWRCTRRRERVRVTPSTLGRKFSVPNILSGGKMKC